MKEINKCRFHGVGMYPNGFIVYCGMLDSEEKKIENSNIEDENNLDKGFIFERKGIFIINSQKLEISLDDLEMDLIDYGLEDLHDDQNEVFIYCAFSDFNILSSRLETRNIEILKTEIRRIPKATKTISLDQAKDVFKLLDLLEENDDVQQVAHDITMTKEILTI